MKEKKIGREKIWRGKDKIAKKVSVTESMSVMRVRWVAWVGRWEGKPGAEPRLSHPVNWDKIGLMEIDIASSEFKSTIRRILSKHRMLMFPFYPD